MRQVGLAHGSALPVWARRLLIQLLSERLAMQVEGDKRYVIGPLGRSRVLACKDELEDALGIAHPSDVVAHDLNRWLERNKHLAQDITRR